MRPPARRPTSSEASVARAAIALGAALIVAGGGMLGYALTRKATAEITPEASAAMASAVGKLDSDIRAARASVEPRARTLSESSYVRRTIGSDAATVTDMLGRELAFKPEPGESLELVQIKQDGAAPESLAVLPEGSGRLTAAPGPAAE